MVLGNLIQLNSVSSEDRYLYGNPQMTHFKSVYKRGSNFAVNYSKIPFVGNVNSGFGKELKFNIPFKADLLSALYFKIKFSDIIPEGVPLRVRPPSFGKSGHRSENPF